MAPKPQTKKPSSQPNQLREEAKQVQQAVIIADSFNERFMPITRDKPRCLLPIVNVPAIEYTLEFLALNGIEECVIVCVSHAELIKEYIAQSRWSAPTADMNVMIQVFGECTSMGEALRQLDQTGLITDDFVLLYGDVVSNMDLARALATHRTKRQQDKNLIMTMVLKRMSPFHRTRERCEGAVFVVDDVTGECVIYEPVDSEYQPKLLKLDSRLLGNRKKLSIHYDLMDCQIDICSPNVLALFTENFDYQDMRRDFIRGVLTSDILGSRVGTYILKHEYAARIRSTRLYDAVSRDIIGRWAYPIVPELNVSGIDPLSHRRGQVYVGKDIILSKTAVVERGSVLASGVTVGENSRISESVIGPNCRIGDNVVIKGAYVWEGVQIGNGCIIEGAIISDNARIKDYSEVTPGCLLAAGVTLGPHARLLPRTRIARWSENIELAMSSLNIGSVDTPVEFLNEVAERAAQVLGSSSDGIVWMDISYPNEDEDICQREVDPLVEAEQQDAFTIGSNLGIPNYDDIQAAASLDISTTDSESESSGEGESKSAVFHREAVEIIRQSVENAVSVDNTGLEINGLKFACNASFADCRLACAEVLLGFGLEDPKQIKSLWTHWSSLLTRFTHGLQDQLDLLRQIVACLSPSNGSNNGLCMRQPTPSLEMRHRSFQYIIPILYQEDVIDEDALKAWYGESTDIFFKQQVKPFIDWLDAQQSESEGESGGVSD